MANNLNHWIFAIAGKNQYLLTLESFMLRKVIYILLIALLPSNAFAELTLQGLAKICEGELPLPNKSIENKLMCLHYMAGALDQVILRDGIQAIKLKKQREYCAPDGITKTEQLSDVIIKMSKEQPELQHESARSIVLGIIEKLYSCKIEK